MVDPGGGVIGVRPHGTQLPIENRWPVLAGKAAVPQHIPPNLRPHSRRYDQ